VRRRTAAPRRAQRGLRIFKGVPYAARPGAGRFKARRSSPGARALTPLVYGPRRSSARPGLAEGVGARRRARLSRPHVWSPRTDGKKRAGDVLLPGGASDRQRRREVWPQNCPRRRVARPSYDVVVVTHQPPLACSATCTSRPAREEYAPRAPPAADVRAGLMGARQRRGVRRDPRRHDLGRVGRRREDGDPTAAGAKVCSPRLGRDARRSASRAHARPNDTQVLAALGLARSRRAVADDSGAAVRAVSITLVGGR